MSILHEDDMWVRNNKVVVKLVALVDISMVGQQTKCWVALFKWFWVSIIGIDMDLAGNAFIKNGLVWLS